MDDELDRLDELEQLLADVDALPPHQRRLRFEPAHAIVKDLLQRGRNEHGNREKFAWLDLHVRGMFGRARDGNTRDDHHCWALGAIGNARERIKASRKEASATAAPKRW